MDYRKFGGTYYVRMDTGDELIGGILRVCEAENIRAAVFTGIGGSDKAEIQTFMPERGEFETRCIEGTLELVSVTGNVITDAEGKYYPHVHAMFAYRKDGAHFTAAGHMKSIRVLYTAEIELRPVVGGEIKRRYDPETGTGFWDFGTENAGTI